MCTKDGTIDSAGKGWYNLNETSYETYCFSKLRRLLALTRYMMEDTLRSLISDNHAKFLAFVQAICSSKVSLQWQHLRATQALISSVQDIHCLQPCRVETQPQGRGR